MSTDPLKKLAGNVENLNVLPAARPRRDVLRFYTARVPEYLRDAVNLLEKLRTAKTGRSSDW
jgi:hypothetical protein